MARAVGVKASFRRKWVQQVDQKRWIQCLLTLVVALKEREISVLGNVERIISFWKKGRGGGGTLI
jgi:hypothetical protein